MTVILSRPQCVNRGVPVVRKHCVTTLSLMNMQLNSERGQMNSTSNMDRLYVWKTVTCLWLVLHTNASQQFDSCEMPLIQNNEVPWLSYLKNTTTFLNGEYFEKLGVLPNNSFVSAPAIEVCI